MPEPEFTPGQRVVWAPRAIGGTVVRSIDTRDGNYRYVVRLDETTPDGSVVTCGAPVLRPGEGVDRMDLTERELTIEAERRAESRRLFGHAGANIPGLWIDWRQEALSLEAQLAGAVSRIEAKDRKIAELEGVIREYEAELREAATVRPYSNRERGQ